MENKNSSITEWSKLYLKKLILSFFIILIPLFIISILLYQFNYNNKKFYFDKVDNKEIYISNRKVVKEKELNEYFTNFEIKLARISKVEKDDKVYEKGNYAFDVNYTLSSFYENSNVSIRYVLKSNYTNIQTDSKSIKITNSKGYTDIDYLHELPSYKYLFFKVGMPTAYFEVKINKTNSFGQHKEEIFYYKVDTNKSKGYEVN